jgi:hypothetical protein
MVPATVINNLSTRIGAVKKTIFAFLKKNVQIRRI